MDTEPGRDSPECLIAHWLFGRAVFKPSPAHWISLGFPVWGCGCSGLGTCSRDLLPRQRQHGDSLRCAPQTPPFPLLGRYSTSLFAAFSAAQEMCTLGSSRRARDWDYAGKDTEPHSKATLVPGLSNNLDTEGLIFLLLQEHWREKKISPPLHVICLPRDVILKVKMKLYKEFHFANQLIYCSQHYSHVI